MSQKSFENFEGNARAVKRGIAHVPRNLSKTLLIHELYATMICQRSLYFGIIQSPQLNKQQHPSFQSTLSTSLQLIDRDPGVGREPLDRGEEELEAARPVRQQRHEQRQLEHGGHVHVVDLRPLKERGDRALVVARGRALTCSSLMATHELEGTP